MDSEHSSEAQGDFYTVEEAAKILGRTHGRIRQLLRAGTLEGEGGGDCSELRNAEVRTPCNPITPMQPREDVPFCGVDRIPKSEKPENLDSN